MGHILLMSPTLDSPYEAILYNSAHYSVMNTCVMSTVGHPGARVRFCALRRIVILLAIVALSASLATRYVNATGAALGKTTSISAQARDAKTQNLLGDGLQWTAPVAALITFVVPHHPDGIPEVVVPVTDPHLQGWLYNRPPPTC